MQNYKNHYHFFYKHQVGKDEYDDYDYEVSREDVINALGNILAKYYSKDKDEQIRATPILSWIIQEFWSISDDFINLNELVEYYKEDLADYFEESAIEEIGG